MKKSDLALLELMKVDLLRIHRKEKAPHALLAWEAARAIEKLRRALAGKGRSND